MSLLNQFDWTIYLVSWMEVHDIFQIPTFSQNPKANQTYLLNLIKSSRNSECLFSTIHFRYPFVVIPFGRLIWILFMFRLRRHLPDNQDLNSKWSSKGYERIICEISRSSGYLRLTNFHCFKIDTILFLSLVWAHMKLHNESLIRLLWVY